MKRCIPRAVLDTCVLFIPTVRGIMFEAAYSGLFQPVWSEMIMSELAGVLMKRGRLSEEAAIAKVQLTLQSLREAKVEVKASLVRRMTNDVKDRHVLAAAVAGRAQFVVTYNLKDFPSSSTESLGVKAVSPDEFLMKLMQERGDEIMSVLDNYVDSLDDSDMSMWTLTSRLHRCNLPVFEESVRRRLECR